MASGERRAIDRVIGNSSMAGRLRELVLDRAEAPLFGTILQEWARYSELLDDPIFGLHIKDEPEDQHHVIWTPIEGRDRNPFLLIEEFQYQQAGAASYFASREYRVYGDRTRRFWYTSLGYREGEVPSFTDIPPPIEARFNIERAEALLSFLRGNVPIISSDSRFEAMLVNQSILKDKIIAGCKEAFDTK